MDNQITNIENFKKSKDYKLIMQIVMKYNRVADREKDLQKKGYTVDIFPIGSGGVGQVKEMSDHFRIQVGYGAGKYNYAKVVCVLK